MVTKSQERNGAPFLQQVAAERRILSFTENLN